MARVHVPNNSKSYQSGIEIRLSRVVLFLLLLSKSYQSGIEILSDLNGIGCDCTLNRTKVELKLVIISDLCKYNSNSKSYQSGIEM